MIDTAAPQALPHRQRILAAGYAFDRRRRLEAAKAAERTPERLIQRIDALMAELGWKAPPAPVEAKREATPQANPHRPCRIIQELVCAHFKIELRAIRSARRERVLIIPRHVAFHLAVKLTDCSLPQIGRACGGRDHTTVLHGIRATAKRMAADPALKATIDQLEAEARLALSQTGDVA